MKKANILYCFTNTFTRDKRRQRKEGGKTPYCCSHTKYSMKLPKLKSNLIMMTSIFTMWDEVFSCAMKCSVLTVSRKMREDVKTTPGILAAY